MTELSVQECQELFTRACSLHQAAQHDEAIAIYRQLLEMFPEAPLLNYNLGLACFEKGQFSDACEHFRVAAAGAPDDEDIFFNLALCLKKVGRLTEAADCYEKILDGNPQSIDSRYNLGGCWRELQEYDKAMTAYRQVLEQDPQHLPALRNLAYTCQLAGNKEEAIAGYRRILELEPDNHKARHLLCALEGSTVERPAQEYVREVFDSFADHYEDSLQNKLDYRVPQLLRELVERHAAQTRLPFLHGLDLGCGSGLGGLAFAEICSRLDGVDLSPKMVALAEQKKLYAELSIADLHTFLQQTQERYDLFLATDVFNYLGELHELFQLLAEKAKKGCLLAFSTESGDGSDYRLQESGRYQHPVSYITSVAANNGWQLVSSQQARLRQEKGRAVTGDLWLMTR